MERHGTETWRAQVKEGGEDGERAGCVVEQRNGEAADEGRKTEGNLKEVEKPT